LCGDFAETIGIDSSFCTEVIFTKSGFCTDVMCIESCFVQYVFVLSHVCVVYFFNESLLLNRQTSDILSYFLLVKIPAIRILTSPALSGTLMEQQIEHVSILKRINFMTPRVFSFPPHKINGLYFIKGYNKFNICSSINPCSCHASASYGSRSKFNASA